MTTISIHEHRLNDAVVALTKLAKKAQRYGNPDISFTVAPEPRMEERKFYYPTGEVHKYHVWLRDITVTGEAPQVNGWEFISRIEFLPENSGHLISHVPGKEATVDNRFVEQPTRECEHCRQNRQRNDVYVLQNVENGQQIQVGSTCLRDFLGIDSPTKVANRFAFWEAVREMEEDDCDIGKSRLNWYSGLKQAVAWTVYFINKEGWVSKSKDEFNNTASRVQDTMHSISDDEYSDEDLIYAQRVIDWVRNEMEVDGDYARNLKTLYSEDIVWTDRHLGLICSAVAVYKREMAKKLEAENKLPSDYVGKVGERLREIKVRYDYSFTIGTSYYGYVEETVLLHRFLDEQGNVYIWKTTNHVSDEYGDVVLTGTVKEHQEYQGVKQTVLTRVKVH